MTGPSATGAIRWIVRAVLAGVGVTALLVLFHGTASAAGLPARPLGAVSSAVSSVTGPLAGDRVSAPSGHADSTTSSTAAPIGAVTSAAAPVVAPVTSAVAPVIAPLTSAVAPVTAPLTSAVTPVTAPLTSALSHVGVPVTSAVAPVVTPVTSAVAPVVAPVTSAVAPVVAPVTSVARSGPASIRTPTLASPSAATTSGVAGGSGGATPLAQNRTAVARAPSPTGTVRTDLAPSTHPVPVPLPLVPAPTPGPLPSAPVQPAGCPAEGGGPASGSLHSGGTGTAAYASDRRGAWRVPDMVGRIHLGGVPVVALPVTLAVPPG